MHKESSSEEHPSALLPLVRLRRRVSKVHTSKKWRWVTHTPRLLHAPPYTTLLTSLSCKPAGNISFQIYNKSDKMQPHPMSLSQRREPTKPKEKRLVEHQRLNPKIRPVSWPRLHMEVMNSSYINEINNMKTTSLWFSEVIVGL